MKMKMLRMLLGSLLLLTLFAGGAWADAVIDFTGGFGGTISTLGVGSAIVGTNVHIGSVKGINTPDNGNGVEHAVSGGVLNFTTGVITSVTPWIGGTYIYNFAPGGSLTISGGVPDAGIAYQDLVFNGIFNAGQFIAQPAPLGGFTGGIIATGSDEKSPELLDYFGLTEVPFNFLGFSISSSLSGIGSNYSFTSTAFSTDIANTANPEPGSMLLLGTGLLVIAGFLRRRIHV